MQQRPHSEGRGSSPPPLSRQRLANRHRKTSALSKSCVLFSESSGGDADYEIVTDDADNAIASSFSSLSSFSELERKTKRGDNSGGYDRHPRRPKTTPKPRIERLLVGPGKSHIQEAHASSSSPPAAASSSNSFFMTHLPDSPPRPSRSTESSMLFASELASSSDDDEVDKQRKVTDKASGNLQATKPHANVTPAFDSEFGQCTTARDEPKQQLQPQDFAEKPETLVESSECEEDRDDEEEIPAAPVKLADPPAATMPVVLNEGRSEPALVLPEKVDGPLQVDLLLSSVPCSVALAQPQLDTSDEEDDLEGDSHNLEEPREVEELTRLSDDLESSVHTFEGQMRGLPEGDNDDDDSEYSRSLATRRRMQQEDRHREQMRGELESYVAQLTSRKGKDGAQLVEFPRNYQQVLSLMSERDVRDEDATATTPGSSNSGVTAQQRSWSHVLIQAGLSKQQAFGALNEEDEASGGEGGMAAKIALKIARVRQLDAVLEEKLGKNLYSSSATTSISSKFVKKPKAGAPNCSHLPPPSSSSNQHSVSTGLAGDSLTSSSVLGANAKAGNFVERNRKVIAHGMKAMLSKDEESRLSRLLRDLGSSENAAESEATPAKTSGTQAAGVAVPGGLAPTEPLGRNEFEMDAQDKKQIEELLAAKRGVYQSTLLPPAPSEINDFGGVNDDDQFRTDGDLSSTPSANKSKSAFNVIQATKSERLRKQRLERIELEIQFLKENEHMAIVPDDDDDGSDDFASLSSGAGGFSYDDNSDVASTLNGGSSSMSERSFRTTTSSVCSTRSGMISRRHFNAFLALEKQDFDPQSKASADDIRRLVASLSHLRTPPATAMSSRPVA